MRVCWLLLGVLVSCANNASPGQMCDGACDDVRMYDPASFGGGSTEVEDGVGDVVTTINALTCRPEVRDYWNSEPRWDVRCWNTSPALGGTYIVVAGTLTVVHSSGEVTRERFQLNRAEEMVLSSPDTTLPSKLSYSLRVVVGANYRALVQTEEQTGALWASLPGRDAARRVEVPMELWRTRIDSNVTLADHGSLNVFAKIGNCRVEFMAANECLELPQQEDFYLPSAAARLHATLFGQPEIRAETTQSGAARWTVVAEGNRMDRNVALQFVAQR